MTRDELRREEIARMLKSKGFTSRDGTIICESTVRVIDAILAALATTQDEDGYITDLKFANEANIKVARKFKAALETIGSARKTPPELEEFSGMDSEDAMVAFGEASMAFHLGEVARTALRQE